MHFLLSSSHVTHNYNMNSNPYPVSHRLSDYDDEIEEDSVHGYKKSSAPKRDLSESDMTYSKEWFSGEEIPEFRPKKMDKETKQLFYSILEDHDETFKGVDLNTLEQKLSVDIDPLSDVTIEELLKHPDNLVVQEYVRWKGFPYKSRISTLEPIVKRIKLRVKGNRQKMKKISRKLKKQNGVDKNELLNNLMKSGHEIIHDGIVFEKTFKSYVDNKLAREYLESKLSTW